MLCVLRVDVEREDKADELHGILAPSRFFPATELGFEASVLPKALLLGAVEAVCLVFLTAVFLGVAGVLFLFCDAGGFTGATAVLFLLDFFGESSKSLSPSASPGESSALL